MGIPVFHDQNNFRISQKVDFFGANSTESIGLCSPWSLSLWRFLSPGLFIVAPEFFHVSFEGVDCPWQSILLYSSVHTAPVHEVAVVQLLVLHVATILQIRLLSCWLDQIPLEPDAIWLNTPPSRKMTPEWLSNSDWRTDLFFHAKSRGMAS